MAVKREKPKAAVPPIAPGDFPVGSVASRAAARALMEKRDEARICLWLRVVGKEQTAPPRIKKFDGDMGFIYGAGFEDYDPGCTEIYRGEIPKGATICT
jgi:hypothetical protein